MSASDQVGMRIPQIPTDLTESCALTSEPPADPAPSSLLTCLV